MSSLKDVSLKDVSLKDVVVPGGLRYNGHISKILETLILQY